MADIKNELSRIKNAVYGKEVRGSIHDGIDKINKETEQYTDLVIDNEQRQAVLEQQFVDQVENMTLDDPSSAEIVSARGNYPILRDRLNAVDDGLSKRLTLSGGELTGSIYLKSPQTDNLNSLNHPSSRLILESYIKSNRPNNHDGDVLQLMWRNQGAKPFIGWWDGAANPEKPELKAWIGAHTLANNPESEPHNHWSIEVSDTTGQLHTRLAIPFDEDHTNIKTSDADFTVGYGTLRVAGERGMNRDLEFADRTNADPSEARFSMRLDANNNFRIIARDDNGNPISSGSPFFIERLTGRVGFGTTTPTHQVHMRSANQALRIEGTSGTTMTPLFVVDHKKPSRRAFGARVDGDSDYRFLIESGGRLAWGTGSGIDTFLHRVGTARLETNSDIIFTGQKGVIIEDSHGGNWRIKVNTDGSLDTIKM